MSPLSQQRMRAMAEGGAVYLTVFAVYVQWSVLADYSEIHREDGLDILIPWWFWVLAGLASAISLGANFQRPRLSIIAMLIVFIGIFSLRTS